MDKNATRRSILDTWGTDMLSSDKSIISIFRAMTRASEIVLALKSIKVQHTKEKVNKILTLS